jgi:hypothetical protein
MISKDIQLNNVTLMTVNNDNVRVKSSLGMVVNGVKY